MKTALFLCAWVVSITSIGSAQETPQYEAFVGGSYLRVHASGAELTQVLGLDSIQYQPHNMNLNLTGWDASITENVSSWFGGEFDASGYYGTLDANFLFPASQLVSPSPNFSKPAPVTTHFQTYLFGPRVVLRRTHHLVYFAHLLFGLAEVSTSLNQPAVVATNFMVLPAGPLKAGKSLALSPGFGIDWRLSERMTVRPFEIDYLMTHVYGEHQDNARVSAGVAFTFGHK